jgi:hypothetical protein
VYGKIVAISFSKLYNETKVFISDGQVMGRKKEMRIGNYEFEYVETIVPKKNQDGGIWNEFPQSRYINEGNIGLHEYGKGAFCKFKLNNAQSVSGVYAWVLEGETDPIYIGETNDFQKRFCMGYGTISPRNCYAGGQMTNCKMNKVVLQKYIEGKKIQIYFYSTKNYKKVELELLNAIDTPYNAKNNKR